MKSRFRCHTNKTLLNVNKEEIFCVGRQKLFHLAFNSISLLFSSLHSSICADDNSEGLFS